MKKKWNQDIDGNKPKNRRINKINIIDDLHDYWSHHRCLALRNNLFRKFIGIWSWRPFERNIWSWRPFEEPFSTIKEFINIRIDVSNSRYHYLYLKNTIFMPKISNKTKFEWKTLELALPFYLRPKVDFYRFTQVWEIFQHLIGFEIWFLLNDNNNNFWNIFDLFEKKTTWFETNENNVEKSSFLMIFWEERSSILQRILQLFFRLFRMFLKGLMENWYFLWISCNLTL